MQKNTGYIRELEPEEKPRRDEYLVTITGKPGCLQCRGNKGILMANIKGKSVRVPCECATVRIVAAEEQSG